MSLKLKATVVPATATLLLSAITLIIIGYQFPLGEHAQYLLHGLRWADPNFCVNEWFIENTQSWHITFNAITYLFAKSDFLAGGFFTLHLLHLAIGIAGLLHLATSLKLNTRQAIVASLGCIVLFNLGLGSSQLFYHFIIPRGFSNGCMLFVISYSIRRRYVASALWLAVVTFFHTNNGLNGALTWLCVLLVQERGQIRNLAPALITYCVACLPFASWSVGPALQAALNHDTSAAVASQAYEFIFRWRSPHHYDISAWGWSWVPYAIPLFIIVTRFKQLQILTAWTAVILSGFLVNLIFSLFTSWQLPDRIYYWNMSIYIMPLVSMWLIREWSQQERTWQQHTATVMLVISLFLLLKGPLAAIGFALIANVIAWQWCWSGSKRIQISIITVWAMTLLFYFLSFRPPTYILFYILVFSLFLETSLCCRTNKQWIGTLLVLALALGLGSHYLIAPLSQRVQLFHVGPIHSVAHWAKQQTPVGSIFVTPPDLPMFRLHSERAIVANFKVVPLLKPQEILEWKRRLEDLIGGKSFESEIDPGYTVSQQLVNHYLKLDADALIHIATKYGAGYLLTYRWHQNIKILETRFKIVFKDQNFIVFQLPEP